MALQNQPSQFLSRFLGVVVTLIRATDALGILTGVVVFLYLAGWLLVTIKIALSLLLGAALLIGGLALFYGFAPSPSGTKTAEQKANRRIAKACGEAFLIVAMVLGCLSGSGKPTTSGTGAARDGTVGGEVSAPMTDLSSQVGFYCEQAASRMMSLSDAIKGVTDLSLEASPVTSPDNDWRSQWAVATGKLKSSGQSVGAIVPVPAEMQKVNGILHQIGEEARDCADLCLRVVDGSDAALHKEAAARLQRIDELLKKVGKLITEAKRRSGVETSPDGDSSRRPKLPQ